MGTISGIAATDYITTAEPRLVFVARPESGKTSMTVEVSTDPGDVTTVFEFAPDFEAPSIGTPTAINCGLTVEVTDNVGVDTANTTVTVTDATGADITDTLTVEGSDNGTNGTITVTGIAATGSYTVTITTTDAANNQTTAGNVIVEITSSEDCSLVPVCLDVDPAIAGQGETVSVTITG